MLSATLCGVSLDNPTILASGILGVSKLGVARMGREGAGAVTLKSLCHEERKGHPAPNMFVIDDGMPRMADIDEITTRCPARRS